LIRHYECAEDDSLSCNFIRSPRAACILHCRR
jgi:hypothetical protein